MQSFEERSVRSWSEASNGTNTGGQTSHFLRSRPLPRPALLSCPLVPFDAWLSATRCARSRARHTPSPRRSRTAADLAQERRGADDATIAGLVKLQKLDSSRGAKGARQTARAFCANQDDRHSASSLA